MPEVRVKRFRLRRLDRPNGKTTWCCQATVEEGPPAHQLLAWLEQLGQVQPLTFMIAYRLAKLADAATGVIRGTQSHLASLIGVNPRTLRAIIRTLRQNGHLRTDRGALNTYTLVTNRVGGDSSATSDASASNDRAPGAKAESF